MADTTPTWEDSFPAEAAAPPTWEDSFPAVESPAAAQPTIEQADTDFRVGEYIRAYRATPGTADFEAGSGNRAFREGIMHGLAGLQQTGIRVLEEIGMAPTGATQDFTVKENARMEEYQYAARFGNPTAKAVNQAVGQFLPLAPTAFIPGGAIQASNAVRTGAGLLNTSKALAYRGARVGVDAAVGSIPGLLTYAQSDEERMTNAAFGAFVSGGVRAGVEAYQLLRPTNILQHMLGVEAALGTKAAKEGAALEKAVGPLNMSELTGSTDVLAGEVVAMRGKGVQGIVEARRGVQYEAALNYFQKEADAAFGATVPVEQIGERVRGGFQKAVDSIVQTRRNNWTFDMAQAKLSGGGRKFIESQSLENELLNLARELGDPLSDAGSQAVARELYKDVVYLRSGAVAAAKDVRSASRTGYAAAPAGGGKISVEQADILLKKYTDWSTKTGRPLKDADTGADRFVGARLKTALLKDLDTTTAASPNDKAVIALKRARSNYHAASADLDALGEEVVAQMVNANKLPAVEHFADVFKKSNITPSQIRGTIDVLNKHDPGAVKAIQRKWIDDALTASTKVDPEKMPGATAFDPKAFLDAVDFYSPKAREVFKGADRARFLTGVQYLERIFPRAGGKVVVPEGGAREVGQTFMNLTSMNAIFIMGQIARTAAPHAFASALFTDKGVNALKIIASPKEYPPSVLSNAVLFVKSLEGDAHETRNQEKPK